MKRKFAALPATLATAFALLMLAAATVAAAVFVKYPAAASLALDAAGGVSVYSADVEINGATAQLSVRVFTDSARQNLPNVLKKLEAAAANASSKSRQAAKAALCVVESPVGPASIIIEISGEIGADPRWNLSGIAQPDGFDLEFSATDKTGKTRLCSGASELSPGTMSRRLADSFAGQGWDSATPAAGEVACAFFIKSGRMALASATPREGGGSSVLVMVKD
jgi:hypothetical protein